MITEKTLMVIGVTGALVSDRENNEMYFTVDLKDVRNKFSKPATRVIWQYTKTSKDGVKSNHWPVEPNDVAIGDEVPGYIIQKIVPFYSIEGIEVNTYRTAVFEDESELSVFKAQKHDYTLCDEGGNLTEDGKMINQLRETRRVKNSAIRQAHKDAEESQDDLIDSNASLIGEAKADKKA